ncbi:MAG TPA: SUF system Fe-S cluster assembly regulator [Gammaproteobacteria bacterium]|nr:SUF system Fe-S cluster assembly regulator [Gammaproteobacteria bacterium]
MSKLTDYGTMVLAQLASHGGALSSCSAVADATHLGQPTVSKLLKLLVRAGLVVSERGVQGGYTLARAPEEITAAEIIDALEGPVAITECSSLHGACDLESFCRVGLAWQKINRSIRKALQDVTLADLQASIDPLPPPDLARALDGAAAIDVERLRRTARSTGRS